MDVTIWGQTAENFAMLAYRGQKRFVEVLAPPGEIKLPFSVISKAVGRIYSASSCKIRRA